MFDVTLRITDLPSEASAKRKALPFAEVEGTSIIIKSSLAANQSLNEHLIFLWRAVRNERRYLKSLQSEGAKITVHVAGARKPIEIKPNSAEMLHLLGATLVIA